MTLFYLFLGLAVFGLLFWLTVTVDQLDHRG
jgi:hypothetical protein